MFRLEANRVVATVRIQNSGNAEDLSLVIPLPSTPEISKISKISSSSVTTFSELEFATRSQFNLRTEDSLIREADGSELGLTIVSKAIDTHGGTVKT